MAQRVVSIYGHAVDVDLRFFAAGGLLSPPVNRSSYTGKSLIAHGHAVAVDLRFFSSCDLLSAPVYKSLIAHRHAVAVDLRVVSAGGWLS